MAKVANEETSSAEALPEASRKYLRVPVARYIVYFFLFFLVFALFEARVEKRTDYGLQRVERLWHGNRPSLFQEDSTDLNQMAQELGVRPDELIDAQHVVEAQLNHLEEEERDFWSRLIVFEGEEYRVFFGARIFLALLLAGSVSTLLYYRQRMNLAHELLEYQTSKFTRVSHQLESKMAESNRIIEKLNRLQDKLVEAEKLASIGRLSATLAHEIRNPLSIIKSSMEIVEEGIEKGSAPESALNLVRDETNRLDRIISDLLSFARPKEPQLERLWIRSLVRHWIPPVVEELEKEKIQLVPQLEDVDGEVVIDPNQLYQIFLNLMWNARDALKGLPNPHVFVRLEDAGDDYLRLVVQDTGTGMVPEVLKQMKEPFFTTKTQGTGLGIPVSVQLLEGMGGRMEVDSALEFGTTVSLFLPRPGARRHPSTDSTIRILRRNEEIEIEPAAPGN